MNSRQSGMCLERRNLIALAAAALGVLALPTPLGAIGPQDHGSAAAGGPANPEPVKAAAPAAQAGARSDVRITVSDVARADELIRVPVNKSVTVDFSVPVREVRIAKAEVAEVAAISPTQILVTGKAFGSTQLIVWINDKEQKVFDVAVDLELERLQASIRAAIPRANVKAHAVMDSVVLTGTVPDATAATQVAEIAKIFSRDVINHMRVGGVQQVLLRCTVAEVNRRVVNQLGFNGWIAGDNVRDMFFLSNLNQINPSNIGAPEGALATATIPFVVGQDGIPVTAQTTMSFGFPRVQMQVFVQALRENGLLRVLAEPNLVTVNGQEASFLAGGEYPIPVPQGGANNAITIEYKEFGVRLRFTPSVLGNGLVRMAVAPEISEPDYATAITLQGYTVPGLVQRRVETVVEVGSGQTFAIGGLLTERVRATARRVPGLGDVPVLGALFTSTAYQSEETELVVLVTPELVEPLNPDQVVYVPGQDYIKPNDWEVYVMGQLEGKNKDYPPNKPARDGNAWPVKPTPPGGGAAPAAPAAPKAGAARLKGPVGLASSADGN